MRAAFEQEARVKGRVRLLLTIAVSPHKDLIDIGYEPAELKGCVFPINSSWSPNYDTARRQFRSYSYRTGSWARKFDTALNVAIEYS